MNEWSSSPIPIPTTLHLYRVCMHIHTYTPFKWTYSIYVCKFNLLTISNKSKYSSSSKNNYEYLQLPLLQCNFTTTILTTTRYEPAFQNTRKNHHSYEKQKRDRREKFLKSKFVKQTFNRCLSTKLG